MFENKKFLREITNILTSSEKAKKVALQEIEKIDEKYRKLAEEEKKSLSETVKNLDDIVSYYSAFTKKDNEEEKVVDNLFEENNEEEAPEEEAEVVDEETETEKHGKDAVHLARKQPRQHTAHLLVARQCELNGFLREDVEMLHGMIQDDACHGNAAQGVGHIDTRVGEVASSIHSACWSCFICSGNVGISPILLRGSCRERP